MAHPAFEALARNHYPEVLAYMRWRTRSAEQAMELAQETFLEALKSFSRFDPERSQAGAWLLGIARNVYLQWLRKQGRDARVFAPLESAVEEAWMERVEKSKGDERLAALEACLDHLDGRSRRLLDGLYRENLGYAELASAFGIGLSAVKVSAFRVRQALFDCIRRKLDAPEGSP
jgi:RNA polymerase sigma-70 factor (ECF subfamily)